jgi:hypothetical protein
VQISREQKGMTILLKAEMNAYKVPPDRQFGARVLKAPAPKQNCLSLHWEDCAVKTDCFPRGSP